MFDFEGTLVDFQWRLGPGDVLFVGDNRADVAAARSAGLAVAIIRGGESSESLFAGDPPDHMISQLDELFGLVTTRAGREAPGTRG
ncbi:MAG: HAD hydrolase-like protein [Burkholderiaceae bacterium]|nr:HAD hydrolase-like protein [Burkholderiaceae bacterium]